MKEFNPEKELKKLNRKFTKKHFIVITSVVLVLAVIGISFANYTVNPDSILIIDATVGEFSKGLNLSKECKDQAIGECLASLSEDKYGEELANDNTSENNVRYIGTTPNNYVTFNNEKWRIIGAFNNMWECKDDETITKDNYAQSGKCTQKSLLKIIRDESIGSYSWDSTVSTTNWGDGVNEWSTSAIQTALNTAYYNSTSGTCYGRSNKSRKDCDFSQTGLKQTAQNQVARVMWNTGTLDMDWSSSYMSTATAQTFYTAERSDYNGKICTSGKYCTDRTDRTTKWIGKVGLMYPSDYGYATSGGTSKNREACLNKELNNWNDESFSDCKNNDWLFNRADQWTMTPGPDSSYASRVFYVNNGGYLPSSVAYYPDGVRPVVYLKSDVQITGGKGTSNDPYTLSVTN